MERLERRLATARAALATLNELVRKPERSKVERDAIKGAAHLLAPAPWHTLVHQPL